MTTSVVSSQLAITALVLLFSCKLSVAHRKLYGGQNAPNPVACGFFDSSDQRDSGVAHQPCFGPDNSVLFCCTSGSSKCSCPIQGSSEYGCYNYESNSTLNAITGEECGYFLPSEKPRSVAMRRELADNCNGNYTICPSTCGPRADLVFFNDLPLAPGVLGCEYENDKSGTDMYDTAECAYFINDGSVDTGFSSPCCDGTQSICALNTPAPTTPAPTTPAPTTPAPTTPAPTTAPTTPTPTTPAPTTPAPTTPNPTTPPPTIPAPTTPAPTTPAPTPVSTTPGPTATNAPTATPGVFPVGGTCDPFSAFPNQCFNTDGSLYTCCMGPCFSGAPGVVPSCTTNSLTQEPTPGPTTTPAPTNPPPSVFPVGGICDASSALPNQCFNSNGDLFTCCPGQCPDTSTASPACATAGGSAPVPTATGSDSATPVPTPAPLTCDNSSNLPNQCFNSDGSRFVCCPSACVATPTLDAVCGPVP